MTSSPQEYWDACLIRTWRNDGKLYDAIQMFKSIVGKHPLDESLSLLRLPPNGMPWKLRIRPFMAQYLEKISARLWDQPPEKDALMLKKLQTSNYTTSTMHTNPDRAMENARVQFHTNENRVAMNHLAYQNRNQESDWSVNKSSALRKKARR